MHEYLGLEGGPPIFRQNFTCSALLKDLKFDVVYGTITHYGLAFHPVLLSYFRPLAWSAFARHY